MSKIVETVIDRWDGGIVTDLRKAPKNTAAAVTNFDIITNPHKMTVYRDSESGDDAASTKQIKNFAVALRTGTTYSLYGLGVTSGTGQAEVYYKDLTTGEVNDLDDGDWTETTNNASGTGSTYFNFFVYYAKTGLLYGAHISSTKLRVWAYDPSGSATWVDSAGNIDFSSDSNSTVAQGLVHSKDDVLYFPYNNIIAKNDNGSWTDNALVLPEHLYITAICEFGNNIAIAMSPKSGSATGRSYVFVWDRDASLTTLSQSFPWEEGVLQVLEVVDGYLVGISLTGNSTTRFSNRVIFRYLTGNESFGYRAEKLYELKSDSGTSTLLPVAKQVIEGRLNFMMQVTLGGKVREGVWSLGKVGDKFVLNHERTPNNNTALSSGILHNFIYVGDYLFQSFTTSSTVTMKKTNNAASNTATSIWESKIFNTEDSSLTKDLVGITITTEPLASGEQVDVFYRTDSTIHSGGSWTQILRHETDSAVSKSAINADTNGDQTADANLPTDYREIQFKIEASGGSSAIGTEVVSLSFKEKITGKRPY